MDIILDPSRIGEWLEGVLIGWGLAPGLAVFTNLVISAIAILIFALTLVLGLIWVDSVSSSRPFDWFGLGDSLDSVFWAVGLFAASVVLASLFVVVSKTLIRVTSAAAQRVLRIPR